MDTDPGPGAPLHERDPVGRFDDRAGDYARFRPDYPPGALDAALEGLHPGQGELVAADVGAGTGISARRLAERGVRVLALEPNRAMRAAAEPHPRVTWRDGSAEATGLDPRSVDLVLCAQSYHWFQPAAACREFGRILRPGGRLALMWNDPDENDPVARGYVRLLLTARGGGDPLCHRTAALDPPFAPPFDPARVRRLVLPNAQRLDAEGLVGRALSASYAPKTGETAERLVADLRELHAGHADAEGLVTLPYVVRLYLCPLDER